MKRRIAIEFKGNSFPPISHTRVSKDGEAYARLVFEGDFEIVENCTFQRYVEVRLLDANNVTPTRRLRDGRFVEVGGVILTWSYEDTLADPLRVGDYVMVPFGYSDKELIAKVEACGDEPEYQGSIKQVSYRLGRDASPRT